MIKQGKRAARITARVRAAAQTGTRTLVASFRSVDSPLGRISSKLRHRSANLAAFAAMEPLERRALFSTVTWVTNGNGDWSNAANWLDDTSVARVPTAADDVIINPAATATITVTGAQSAKSLTMTGDDTLSLTNSSLALTTASDIKQLTLIGSGTVNTAADLTLSGTSSMANASVLGGAGRVLVTGTLNIANGPTIQNELRLSGTIAHTGGTLTTSGANAVVKIISGGQFNATGLSLLRTSGGQGVVVEAGGTFSVVASTVTTNGGLTINGGTVAAPNTGTSISFNGATSVTNATFNVAAGSFMAFNSNAANPVAGTIVGTGVGQVVINGSSSFSLAADTSFNFAPDQLQFQNSASIDGPGVLTSSGDINGSPVLRTKVISTGTFTANGVVNFATVDAELRITSGTSFTSTGMTLVGSSTSKGLFIEGGGTLHALGAFNTSAIPLTVQPNGVLKTTATSMSIAGVTSLDAAVFDTTAGGSIIFQPTSVVGLKGTITGTGGANTVVFGNNTGTFNTDAAGASLNLAAGMAVTNSPTFAGPGVLTISSDLNVRGTLTIQGEVRVAGTLSLIAANPHLSLDGPSGLVRVLSGGLLAPSSNVNGQTFFDNASQGIKIDAGGKLSRNSSGQLTINTPVDNLGTIESLGGNIVINGNITQLTGTVGNYTLGGGTWIQRGLGFFDVPGKSFNTIGAGATVVVGFANNFFPPTNQIANIAGTLRLVEGRDLPLGASLNNSGNIILEPGTSLSVGTFTQTSTGVTEFQIAGTGAANIGQLIGTGAATLAGTAQITRTGGFVPTLGQSFTLQTFPSRSGTYTNVLGLNVGGGVTLEAVHATAAFSLNTITGGAADLAVTSVTIPPTALAGQDFTFSYNVKNNGGATTATTWQDAIYLSRDGTLDGSDTVIATVTHTGAVAADGTYVGNVTVPMAGALPGDYHVIVVADADGQSADLDRSDNALASTSTLSLDVPALTPGVAHPGVIRNGQSLFYRVTLPAGVTPVFTLTGAVAGQAELFHALGRIPSPTTYDATAFNVTGNITRLTGATNAAATYYILVRGRERAGAGTGFSLLAVGSALDVHSTTVGSGANIGRVSMTLAGSLFTANTVFSLVPSSGPTIPATFTSVENAGEASVTFNLQGAAPGVYGIRAQDGAATDTLAGAFTVTAGGSPGKLEFSISAPAAIRPNYQGTAATISYRNVGSTDLDAPLFNLYGLNAQVRLEHQPDFLEGVNVQTAAGTVSVVELLGVSGGLAGVLSPGESGQIRVLFQPINQNAHTEVKFDADLVTELNTAIDWDAVKETNRPAGVATDAWDAIYGNFKAAMGTTVGSYIARLVEDANYLGQFEQVTPETSRLVMFELDRATGNGAIESRYALGDLGRGRAAPYSAKVIESLDGTVTITDGVDERTFYPKPGGGYTGLPADAATLTKGGGGVFTLVEANGLRTVFRASDGRINFIEDTNGARITCNYAGGKLIGTLNSVTGDATAYGYNGFGRLATITDAVGRITTLTYDVAGEHLLTIATPQGTTSFTYVTGQGATREHAIASVTDAAGVTTTFSYDARGRLTQQSSGAGADVLTYTLDYDSVAGVTLTDPLGHQTRSYRGSSGGVVRSIDAIGNVSNAVYDAAGRVIGMADPNGASARVLVDAAGSTTTVVNNDQSTIGMEFGGSIRRIRSLTNPNGVKTTYTYDAAGNLLARHLPNGASETFEYDSAGRATSVTNANGEKTTYTYNSDGTNGTRTQPGGLTTTYTYDTRRNLLTATDASGTTTFTYDSADRLTSATYPTASRSPSPITRSDVGRRSPTRAATRFATATTDSAGSTSCATLPTPCSSITTTTPPVGSRPKPAAMVGRQPTPTMPPTGSRRSSIAMRRRQSSSRSRTPTTRRGASSPRPTTLAPRPTAMTSTASSRV